MYLRFSATKRLPGLETTQNEMPTIKQEPLDMESYVQQVRYIAFFSFLHKLDDCEKGKFQQLFKL